MDVKHKGVILILCITFMVEPRALSSGDEIASQWNQNTEPDRLRITLEILNKLPTSRKLYLDLLSRLHMRESEAFNTLFQWSAISRTNAVLTRYFNPTSGEEVRQRQITIFLKRNQSLANLILDVAHEMTHALYSPQWDPYDPSLTAATYLWNAIEGPGGEVDALVVECQVAQELKEKYGVQIKRCQRYLGDPRKKLNRKKIRNEFYQVGPWEGELKEKLGTEFNRFPFLSPAEPSLISSTGNAPYPIALLREYTEFTRIACENSRKRLLSIQKPHGFDSTMHPIRMQLEQLILRRCQGISIASLPQ